MLSYWTSNKLVSISSPPTVSNFQSKTCISQNIGHAFDFPENSMVRSPQPVKCLQDHWKFLKYQSSKDSTSPMSETCKIRAGQVKFQDRKPDLNVRNIGQNKPEFLSLKVNKGRYADPYNQRHKWVPL